MPYSYQLFSKQLLQKRTKQNLTMQELAERAGVSKSMISKIEKQQVYPSIKTASKLAEALQCTLADLFLMESKGNVIHYPASKQFEIDDDGYFRRFMSPSVEKACVEVFHERLIQNASTSNELHQSDEKYIVALEEGLTLIAEGKSYDLKLGDSVHVAQKVSHQITNTLDKEVSFITIIHHKHEML